MENQTSAGTHPDEYARNESPQNVTPRRVQLRRTKGYRKPDGVVVVARPTKWGNPFAVNSTWMVWAAVGMGYMGDLKGRREAAVAFYRAWITGEPIPMGLTRPGADGGAIEFGDGTQRTLVDHALGISRFAATLYEAPPVPEAPDVSELRGRDLACWCPLDLPCHADVLLEVANA